MQLQADSGDFTGGNITAWAFIDPDLLTDEYLAEATDAQALAIWDPAGADLESIRTAVVAIHPTAQVRSMGDIDYDQSTSARELQSLVSIALSAILVIAASGCRRAPLPTSSNDGHSSNSCKQAE